jgi:hypothetical protein
MGHHNHPIPYMLKLRDQAYGEIGVTKVAKVKDVIHLFEREDSSKRKIAKYFRIPRGTVDRVVANPDKYLPKSEPVDRTSPEMTTQIMAFIDGIIESDKRMNRRQRHASKRIWERVLEHIGPFGELEVRRRAGASLFASRGKELKQYRGLWVR